MNIDRVIGVIHIGVLLLLFFVKTNIAFLAASLIIVLIMVYQTYTSPTKWNIRISVVLTSFLIFWNIYSWDFGG
ncbi:MULTISPECIES: hypothetical protein [Paenibacillus]|jgi:hypothetical protein|uniref:Uncharacterized protein n=1 Tax=Paenibacillus illinoisensis TaxID=59845 RepID=A0A2W0CFN2_9BACL|nr:MULTISPECIES: hypothetical protein [Paenibacillus]PAD31244.1 hypothetical protein CHH60_11060 [Paenibacillus sp. 7523-1]PYY28862.1 Uncharacterized protein PIL02S_02829 [Paenibacillus illinoisensis]